MHIIKLVYLFSQPKEIFIHLASSSEKSGYQMKIESAKSRDYQNCAARKIAWVKMPIVVGVKQRKQFWAISIFKLSGEMLRLFKDLA